MFFILISTMFFIKAEGTQQQQQTCEITLAVYDGPGSNCGPGFYTDSEDEKTSKKSFPYEWEVGNKKYRIIVEPLLPEHVRYGIPDDYDILLMDGGNEEEFMAGFPLMRMLLGYKDVIPNLENFILNGGGYIGNCGGAAFALDMEREFRTFDERIFENNRFLNNPNDKDVLDVKLSLYYGTSIIGEYLWMRQNFFPIWRNLIRHPEYIASGAYYEQMFKPESNGVPFNLEIREKNHPIFKDYLDDTFLARYVGGPAFTLPSTNNENIKGLAYIKDEEDISNNENTGVKAWGWRPCLNDLLKIIFSIDPSNYDDPEEDFAVGLYDILEFIYNTKGWVPLDMPKDGYVDEGHESKTALVTIDKYNGEKGRVVLFGGHPTITVWDREGTYIKNVPWNGSNTPHWGFYRWWDEQDPENENDDVPLSETGAERPSNLEWLIRREVAWAAGSDKVPDDHLPPIYGRSQVVDLEPYQSSEEFTVDCAVGDHKYKKDLWDNTTLTLYYKYFADVPTDFELDSAEWVSYDSVYNFPWSYTFDADDAEGAGVYYFCSILNTINVTGFVECEEFPPGPDTYCFVKESPYADFTNEPISPYTNMNITFYDQSLPSQNIISWSWDFGDGNTSTDQNATHQYTENGDYTVMLNVTDNESNYQVITKNITVQNTLPVVGFKSTPLVIIGPDDEDGDNPMVSFESSSTDPDGNIVNWTWDFGDGTMGYGESVNHTYSEMGYYPVTLRVTDDDNTTCEEFNMDCILVANAMVNKSLTFDDPGNYTWNSIQKGLDNLSTFNLLYVLDNTYVENITLNKSVILLGENRDNVIIDGSIKMNNPFDYELLGDGDNDFIVNMSGNCLLFHFNNDTSVGENYSSSNVVVDSSGQGNNGTFYGTSWIDSSIKGAGGFNFNGISNTVNVSSISALTGENVTVSAWIYWTEGSGNFDPILSQSNDTNGYCLYINNTDSKPVFELGSTNVVSSTNLNVGWHHVVGTHNGTSSLLKIYVDGKNTGYTNIAGVGINSSFFVGFDNVSSYFNGMIDEVAVWNRTLSDDEIYMMYHGNFGSSIACLTVQNADIGIVPCNHSIIYNCTIVNNTIGIYCNDSLDVTIDTCNISGGSFGIQIFNSTPGIYHRIRVIDSNIYSCNKGLVVNNSSTISIASSYFNCTSVNMRFNESNFSTIYVLSCDSASNVAPDIPDLTGNSLGDPGVEYTFSSITNDSNFDQILYMFDWGDNNTTGWLNLFDSNILVNSSHTFENQGGYYIRVKTKDVFNDESGWSEPILFRTETLPPLINSVVNSPDVVGFGFNVTITANVTDDQSGNYSGIKSVKVNFTYPDSSNENFTMNNTGDNVYEYTIMDTWKIGKYNYTIWAMDNAYNSNSSSGHSFNVSAQATISVCTVKDEYGNNETVNLTDPPAGSTEIGYDLLDGGNVLHIWNNYDSYYFNTSSGIQLTNHYDEYWSHNVLMLGYYNNDQWNRIYRTDELSGFNKDIDTDDETYVNATLWKDLTYHGYNFRLAIRYHLGVEDKELTVIPYIKNLGQAIPYVLGFAWELKDIQVDMTPENDYIEINGTTYYLNQSLDETYKNMNQSCFYIREDISSDRSESLYLCWNDSLDYLVKVKSREGQYNAPVTLGIKIGTLAVGQEKYTSLLWHDSSEKVFYFNSYSTGETWATNPGYMVDGSTSTYASTNIGGDVELCNGNNCSGSDLGDIVKVELRVFGYYASNRHDIVLTPVFGGTTYGGHYTYMTTTTPSWSQWFDITTDPFFTPPWSWTKVDNLDCDVEAKSGLGFFTLYCSKVEIRATYIPESNSVISNPYPADGSTGISIVPVLNITVADPDGDSMNITWLSNSSGSWQVFGTNKSVSNGTYHQTMANASVNGEWWYWKVSVTDGAANVESSVYKFYTGYESKIENTGSTNISGYLLIQVQYYNSTSEEWVVDNDTVNESSPRTILWDNPTGPAEQNILALDTIFNGQVNTSDLSHGDGLYRIYAAFRDPDGNVLVTDDETELEAWYEFEVNI